MITDAQMIGAALRGEREKRNISRLEASRLSGVYREQMPNWESGANCISLPMLRLLAEAYGMTPSQIGRVVMGGLTPVKVPQARKPGVVQNVCWRPNKKMRKELA